jgi:hypothetical protein
MITNLDDREVYIATYSKWRQRGLPKIEEEVARVAKLRYEGEERAEYDAYWRLLTLALLTERRKRDGKSGLFFCMKNFVTG